MHTLSTEASPSPRLTLLTLSMQTANLLPTLDQEGQGERGLGLVAAAYTAAGRTILNRGRVFAHTKDMRADKGETCTPEVGVERIGIHC